MSGVYIFLLVLGISVCEAASIKDQLSAPHVNKIITFDPAGIRLKWEPVEGTKNDPVIGYRMKVWELSHKVYRFEKDENGKSNLVAKVTPIEDPNSFDYTKAEPKWIVDVGAEMYDAEVNGVSFDIFYELRVHALTKNGEGPISNRSSVAIISKK